MTITLRTHILLAGLLWSALLFAPPPAANAGLILQAPTYIGLNSGLVGWWTFDGKDTAGSITYDRSGQGNNGTLTAGTVRGLGNIGQAMEFDGVDDSIDFTTTNGLDNLGQMTVSLWVRPHTFGESDPGAAFIAKSDQECFGSLDGGWTFGIDWSGGIDGSLCFQKGYQDQNLNVASVQDTVTLNEWQHVVVVWDGTAEADNVRFYRNASLAGIDFSEDGTGALADDSTFDLGIGEQPGDSTLNFDGSMDDVRIYNRALSAGEIKRLYKIGSTLKYGAPNSTGSLSQGLVGWWTFDGNDIATNNSSVTKVIDRSRNGNDGTFVNGPRGGAGTIGQALSFDGINDYVDIVSNMNVNGSGLTIAAWVKPNNMDVDFRIVSKAFGGQEEGHLWMLSNCSAATGCGGDNEMRVRFNIGGEINVLFSNSPALRFVPDEWQFVAVTYDGDVVRFFRNGVSEVQDADNGTLGTGSEVCISGRRLMTSASRSPV